MDQLFTIILYLMPDDASRTTRAVSTPSDSYDEIMRLIDPTITYGKGAAIVRMLTYIIGEDCFNHGLTVRRLSLERI